MSFAIPRMAAISWYENGGRVSYGRNTEGSLTKGDIAILRFLAAAELVESDLWTQYRDLGGLNPGQVPVEVNPNQHMNGYQAASRTWIPMARNISPVTPLTKSATLPSSTPI